LDPHALAVAVERAERADRAERTVGAPSEAAAVRKPEPARDIVLAGLAAALGMTLAFLVAHKSRAFAAACRSRGVRARGLLPIPDGVRAPLAGAGLTVALLLQVEGRSTAGAACVSMAMLATALRASRTGPQTRGPGRWRTLPLEHVFSQSVVSCHWLDVDSRVGRAAATVALMLCVAGAILARRFHEQGAWLAAMDAAVLLPLFTTGRISQLPPNGAAATAQWLARALPGLRAIANAHVRLLARIAPDGVTADELRLLIVPRMGLAGVVALEVGLAWSSTPVCWAATPEVLARVTDCSPAAAKLAADAPRARSTPGRRPDERVVRLLPRSPSPSGTVALVRRLVEALTDRRATPHGDAWTGLEKRADLSGLVIRSLAGLDRACLVPPCTL
jgi:hypothetical protein